MHNAQTAAELGASLTERLLQFARRSPLDPQVVNLDTLINQVVPLLHRTLGETILLTKVLSDIPWHVKLDPSQFQSAIVNLVINARDAMPDGGRLIIETKNFTLDGSFLSEDLGLKIGDYVAISITDTGRGMPPEIVERVFEPFFTTKPIGAGTGLGLSMVHGFIKQSGGNIKIYSEISKGTTVNLYVPCSIHAAPTEVTLQTKPFEHSDDNGRLILVVEDNLPVLTLTCARLEAIGYKTLSAPDGPAAIIIMRDRPEIDLVLTDLVMPGNLSGYEIAQHVHENFPHMKVVLTSGYAEELINADKLTAHNLTLLRKPYRQALLAQTIQSALMVRTQPS